jgi:hypothetical protein
MIPRRMASATAPARVRTVQLFVDVLMTIVCPYHKRSVAPEILGHTHSTHPHCWRPRGSQTPH